MDQELENKLYEKYPNLFSNKDKDVRSSCMAFGCEHGDGWYEILSSLCFMVKQHEDNDRWRTEYKQKENPDYVSEYVPVKFDQIKEKFGGLRIYFSGGDEYIEGLVSMAESFSYQVCELCGERGKPNNGGWITTLCDKCRNKNE